MVLLFELKIEPFFGGVYPEKNTVITEINNNLLYGWTLGWTPSTVEQPCRDATRPW